MRRKLLTHALIVALQMDQLRAEREKERDPYADAAAQVYDKPPQDGERKVGMPAALGAGYGSEA